MEDAAKIAAAFAALAITLLIVRWYVTDPEDFIKAMLSVKRLIYKSKDGKNDITSSGGTWRI